MLRFISGCVAAMLLVCAPFGAAAEEVDAKASLISLFGEAGAQSFADIVPADHEFEFKIYLPEGYDAATPAGVFVFVSPTAVGDIPRDWEEVFDRNNLIWISVMKSGNARSALARVVDTLASISYAQGQYSVDPNRFYLGGFSGGGRVASITSMFYPEIFDGVVYICGVNSFKDEPNAMVEAMKKNSFVFLTGTEDYNRRETQKVYGEYKRAGFEHIKMITVPTMQHRIPDADDFEDVIKFFDAAGE